jgi:hypothetical protein
MTTKLVSLLAAALLTAAASRTASAQEGAGNSLGHAGQIAIQSDFQISFQHESVSAADDGEDPDSSTTIILAPGLDYFVTEGLSIGGQAIFQRLSSGDLSVNGVGVAPRLGYFLPLGPRIGLWPTAALAYLRTSVDLGELTDSVSGYELTAAATVPLLFQPADHFFIGIGPTFSTELISKVEDEDADKSTRFGLASTVGGYW